MRAKAIMVLGTTSGAGKSWLSTALCRWYARQGFKVAPFKAQNMSNNARVVAGGEIGSAQYFQALAARVPPDVRMNPVLLKPEADTRSQVVLLGKADRQLSRIPWRRRSAKVWPLVKRSLDELLSSHDVVVIEGAGSPAEINLQSSDIVNMRIARHARAQCLLVTDIDRGGAFAHLYGTWMLLDKADRRRIKGFVLNKFRGDAALLSPGPQKLQRLTGIPTVAVLPMWRQHGLPEEDGVFDDRPTGAYPLAQRQLGEGRGEGKALALIPAFSRRKVGRRGKYRTIAIVAYPHISNLDEFQPLKNIPGVRLKWARTPVELEGADWIVLPGSKHTSGDLAWLRAQGLDRAVQAHASAGKAVLGICGGLQMLGHELKDPHGMDGSGTGLGLLPLVTEFQRMKEVRRKRAQFGSLSGPWKALSNLTVEGYEIHNGRTGPKASKNAARPVIPENLAWQNEKGNVLGIYLHGLFEDPAALKVLFSAAVPSPDTVFEGLADFINKHFQPNVLKSLLAKDS